MIIIRASNEDYRDYCKVTDTIWSAILQTKTIESFLMANRVYTRFIEQFQIQIPVKFEE